MERPKVKVGDRVLLLDDETGKPYKYGVVDKYDESRGRVGVKTETGSYACWNLPHLVKV